MIGETNAHVGLSAGLAAARPDRPGRFVALAPMDGITDWVHRDLITEAFGRRGAISACVTEFVRVCHAPVDAAALLRACPELSHGGHTRAGTPVYVQLLGSALEPMAETARTIVALGGIGVDLNFGCPAKTVNRHDGGAALLKAPCRIEQVVSAVRAAVPLELPVSAKIRLGWEDSEGVAELARAAERGGATWVTVHARTRAQGYQPPVDWYAIGRARQAVSIPVVANGDLFAPEDLARCREHSGCEAFMIGRAALGTPELFGRVCGQIARPHSLPEHWDLLTEYVARMSATGASEHHVLGRAKQWLRVGLSTRPELAEIFATAKLARSLGALLGHRAAA